MKPRRPNRSWNLTQEDLPSEEAKRRATYFVELENNAVFRLLTYRATPFWRRGDFLLSLTISLVALGLAIIGHQLWGLGFFCASGLIFYLARLVQPDEAVLDELTVGDMEDLVATRVGVRDVALGIWGVRTSRRWIASRVKAARIAFWSGWVILFIPFIFRNALQFLLGTGAVMDTIAINILGMLLIAGGASIPRRMLANPAHALPQLLVILDRQIKRIEARDQTFDYHVGRFLSELFASILRFLSMFVWFFALIFAVVIAQLILSATASGKFNLFIPADLQGLIMGAIAWLVGRTDGEWWREYVEPDMRKNYMELMEKVQFIMRREYRHIRQGDLEQRFPHPKQFS